MTYLLRECPIVFIFTKMSDVETNPFYEPLGQLDDDRISVESEDLMSEEYESDRQPEPQNHRFTQTYYPLMNEPFIVFFYLIVEITAIVLYGTLKTDACPVYERSLPLKDYVFATSVGSLIAYCIATFCMIFSFGAQKSHTHIGKIMGMFVVFWRYFLGAMIGIGICSLINSTCAPGENNIWYGIAIGYTAVKLAQFFLDALTTMTGCEC